MRLIYQNGQQVGPEPIGLYVYLWRHNGVDRYVGKGSNGRWLSHTDPKPNDRNQKKMRYFRRFRHQMECFIVAEDVPTQIEVADLEESETRQRGLRANGGPLLNARIGNAGRYPRHRKYTTAKGGAHVEAWKAQPDFPREATFQLIGSINPWRRNSAGHRLYTQILRHAPTTIGEIIDRATHQLGLKANDTLGHLAWLYTDLRYGPQIAIDGRDFTGKTHR
jgi:hypothetical protein